MEGGLQVGKVPRGFAHDVSRSRIGEGERQFEAARQAFRRWLQFDLGWVRVANPEVPIETGQIVAVEVKSLGLWSLNLSRIMETVDQEDRFGFIYATTELHVEEGEECFLLRIDRNTGSVSYRLEAISRPRDLFARAGYPITRHFQHRFARDSQRRVYEAVIDNRSEIS
jgi:uncharacterized protein (UPF0548 family)